MIQTVYDAARVYVTYELYQHAADFVSTLVEETPERRNRILLRFHRVAE